jgi:hypothetical protein
MASKIFEQGRGLLLDGDLGGTFGGRETVESYLSFPVAPDESLPRSSVRMEMADGTSVTLNNVAFVLEESKTMQDTYTPISGIGSSGTFTFTDKDQEIANLKRDLGLAILRAERAEKTAERLLDLIERLRLEGE